MGRLQHPSDAIQIMFSKKRKCSHCVPAALGETVKTELQISLGGYGDKAAASWSKMIASRGEMVRASKSEHMLREPHRRSRHMLISEC